MAQTSRPPAASGTRGMDRRRSWKTEGGDLAPIAGEHRTRVGDIATRQTPSNKDKQAAMANEPIELDEHRGMNAQKDTEIRRRLYEVQADQAALQERQAELEKFLIAAPAVTWAEAAAKARYLIQLFAGTVEAQDARRQKLIANVLEELTRLSE